MAIQRVGWRSYVSTQTIPLSYLLDTYGGAAAAYSLRKLSPTYSGSAIRVRRSSDNAETNIGFDSNGNLDTTTLSTFTNPTDNTKLLDSYTGASVAYSLRKLSSTYSGSAIRVRRSSDNTEMNIGFTAGGDLDSSTLLSFVGTGNGFVTTWYDQSGSGNNAFQTSASVQPQIVSNGSLILRNSKPYIEATSTRYFQFTTEIINLSGNEYSLWMTYEKDNNNNNAILLTGSYDYMWLDYGASQAVSRYATISISAHASNTLYLINTIAGNSGSTMYRNSLSIGSGGVPGEARSTNLPASSYRSAKITMSEFIYYPTNKTSQRAGISTNMNGYYSIHSPNTSSYVTTIYDQSGNGRHATQTTASSQPLIISNGTLNLVNGKPAIYFNGSNFISSPYNQGSNNEMYFVTQTTDTEYLYPSNTGLNYGFVSNQSSSSNGLYSNYGSPLLYSNGFQKTISNRNDIYNALNGSKLSVHKGANLSSWAGNPTLFGTYNGGGYSYIGNLQEWLIYPSLQGSQSSIESNINKYYSLWDSSIVTSGLILNLDASYKASYPESGTTWYDISGRSNNNGSMMNGVTYASSSGGVMTFDGVNDYVNCPIINTGNVFTVQVWAKISRFGGGPSWNRATLVANSYNWGANTGFYFFATSQNGANGYAATPGMETFSIAIGQDVTGAGAAIGSLSNYVNKWVNLSAVVNGTNPIRLYMNGVEVQYSGQGNGPSSINYNNACTIGSRILENCDYNQGSIGSVYMYNRALSASELLQNYNATKSRFGL